MKCLLVFLSLFYGLVFSVSTSASAESLITSAEVFSKRCTLCHGRSGMGDGIMTLLIKDYPISNLLDRQFGDDVESTLKNIKYGGSKGQMSHLSPPWLSELKAHQIIELAAFIELLNSDTKKAISLLKSVDEKMKSSANYGRALFLSRCVDCHGASGKGDGRLAGVLINNPKPYNLTKSTKSMKGLQEIISLGGEKLGRSKSMPSWSKELSASEIKSIAAYLMTIRE